MPGACGRPSPHVWDNDAWTKESHGAQYAVQWLAETDRRQALNDVCIAPDDFSRISRHNGRDEQQAPPSSEGVLRALAAAVPRRRSDRDGEPL